MAIVNVKGIERKCVELNKERENAVKLRKSKVDMYYSKIMEERERMIDAIDTANYLRSKKVEIKHINFGYDGNKYDSIRLSSEHVYIYPFENKIKIGSSGYGMSEQYDIVENNVNDHTNNKITDGKDHLGCGSYTDRFDSAIIKLPVILDRFFEYVNNL